MITPSFSPTATERVLPKLALDFTTANLDSRITFTRTTGISNPATYVASNGNITSATNNQPRFDYDPVTLACKGLLIEESRTNYYPASNNFSTTWSYGTTLTLSTASTVSPDGTLNATKLTPSTVSELHRLYLVDYKISGSRLTGDYTISIYAKPNGYNRIGLVDTYSGLFSVLFDVSTTSVINGSNATITDAPNGYKRCTVKFTGTGARIDIAITIVNNTLTNQNTAYIGNGTSGVDVFGFQIEAGAFATSYIPTTTTSLTRNADVATMTGTNFSDWYNASEGTFVVSLQAVNGRLLSANDGTTSKRILVAIKNSATQFGGAVADTTTQMSLSANVSDVSNINSVSLAYKANSFAYDAAAGAIQTDNAGTVPTVNQLQIGAETTFQGTGWFRKINYYPQRLINAEVQAFSK